MDSNKEDSAQSLIEADEAKKIVESITDSITGGEKQERTYYISFLDILIIWDRVCEEVTFRILLILKE